MVRESVMPMPMPMQAPLRELLPLRRPRPRTLRTLEMGRGIKPGSNSSRALAPAMPIALRDAVVSRAGSVRVRLSRKNVMEVAGLGTRSLMTMPRRSCVVNSQPLLKREGFR